jgi:hypothetical protein
MTKRLPVGSARWLTVLPLGAADCRRDAEWR